MLIREIYPEEKENYNEAVDHILQSYEWGIFKETTGIKVIRLGFFESIIRTGFLITIHPIPNTSYSVGYVPRCPELTEEIIKQLKKIAEEHNCVFIKVESIKENKLQILNKEEQNKIQIIPSSPVLPEHSFLIDLKATEEEILSRMKEKTRYNIKLSKKHGVFVDQIGDNVSLEIFIKLAMDTAERQGFFSHPADYYRKLWEILRPYKMVYLLVAKYQNTPLAAIMLFKFKDKLYYPYGGSATIMREKMPNHLLHFEAIKLGKSLGCNTYDMWGAYKNKPDEKDPWFGIYRFKEGFGGNLITYPQAIDLVYAPKFYKLYKIADPLRFKLLEIKRLFKNNIISRLRKSS